MAEIKILGFSGSTRKESYNTKLVKIALKGAEKAGAKITYVDLADYPFPIFNEDVERESGAPEKLQELKDLFQSHDGFLIASPEYNSSFSALLKNTIDWVSRSTKDNETPLSAYQGKVAGIMSASPGGLGGLRGLVSLRSLLENIGVMVLPDQRAISKAYEAFDDFGNLKDAQANASIQLIGSKLYEITSKLK